MKKENMETRDPDGHPCWYYGGPMCFSKGSLNSQCPYDHDMAIHCQGYLRKKSIKTECTVCGKPLFKKNLYCKKCRDKNKVEDSKKRSAKEHRERGRFRTK